MTGLKGRPGIKGIKGEFGPPGAQGDKGSEGARGFKGICLWVVPVCLFFTSGELFYKDTKTKMTHFSHGIFSSSTFLHWFHTWASGQEAWILGSGKGYFFVNLYTFKVGDRHLIIQLSSDSGASGLVQNSTGPFPKKHKVFGGKDSDFAPVAL